MTLRLCFITSGEIYVQGIEIEHRRESDIVPLLLLEEIAQIILHCGETPPPAAIALSMLFATRREDRLLNPDSEVSQVRSQDFRDIQLLGLPLDVEVEPYHQYGPPPITFRSQRLPSE